MKEKIRILLLQVVVTFLVCILNFSLSANTFDSTHEESMGSDSAYFKESGAKVLHTRKLTIEDGLTTSEIRAIAQDHNGYIWIGTPAGLNRYDGYSIKQYVKDSLVKNSLSNNDIQSLLVDHLGQLWIATNQGLNRYDETNDSFIVYQHDSGKDDSLNSNFVTSLFEDHKNRLWIGTRAGINVFDPIKNSFRHYEPDNNNSLSSIRPGNVEALNEDNLGQIWIGTISASTKAHRGLTLLEPELEKFTHFDNNPNDNNSLQEGSINSILKLSNGRIFVVSFSGVISEYLPMLKAFNHLAKAPKNVIKAFLDSQENIWLLTRENGLFLFDYLSNTFTHSGKSIINPLGLNDDSISSIFEDRDGLIWIGTGNKGINIFDPNTLRFNHILPEIQLSKFKNSNIRSITELHDGRIALGTTSQGFVIYNPNTNTFVPYFETTIDGYSSLRANGIVSVDKNRLLVGSNSGVYILDLSTEGKQYISLSSSSDETSVNIKKIYRTKDGLFWLLSAGKGLFSLDLSTLKVTHFPYAKNTSSFDNKMLSSYYPRDIFEDDSGLLWIATQRGLNRFDRVTETFVHYVNDPKNLASIPENKIFTLRQDGLDKIWLGTNNGLVLFNKKEETFKRFTTHDGLPDNNIYCMVATDNNLWLGTNKGLSRWNKKDFSVTNYFAEEGLQNNEFNTSGCSKGFSGNLYFSGINGFNYFKEDSINVTALAAPLLISEIQLDQLIIPLNGNAIEIPHDINIIQLEFRALQYSAPQLIHYQIQLENFDEEWRDIGNKNNTIYTNLSAGKYIFKVKAINQYGVVSEEIKITIVKLSHPFLTLHAIFIYFILVLLLIVLFIRRHQKQLATHKDIALRETNLSKELRQLSTHLHNAREEERAVVARELHDELAQILVAIKLEISWIESSLGRNNELEIISRIPEIHEVIDTCVNSVRQIATGLRPSVLDDMGLVPALEWYVTSICQRAKLRIAFTTNCETISLSKDLSINLYRIVQESVTNIIKHAYAKKISLSCFLNEQNFHLRIRDDGIGIKVSDMNKPGHYGLIGIRERVANYSGSFKLSANQPTGLIFDIIIPIDDYRLDDTSLPDLD